MTRRFQENIVILLVLAFFVGIFVMSLDYGPRARLVPITISVLAIGLLLFQFVWQNVRSADELNIDLLEVLTERGQNPGAAAGSAKPDEIEKAGQGRRMAVAFGMVALFIALIMVAGPMPSIFVFTAGYFVVSGHYSIGRAVAYSAIFAVATYLVFVEVLQLQLYHGYLEPVAEYIRRL